MKMASNRFSSFLYLLTLFIAVFHFQTLTTAAAPGSSTKLQNGTTSESASKPNSTEDCLLKNCTSTDHSFLNVLNNKPMLMRAFYVLLAVTSIVVVYFVIRAWRLRRKRSKSRKYGLITARGTDMEMAPLDQDDDDDEDMTVYEMNSRKK